MAIHAMPFEDGMNAMAKHLATQLVKRKSVDIGTGVTVSSIARVGEGWEVRS